MARILVAETIAETAIDALKADFDVDYLTDLSPDEMKERIQDYDALIIRSGTNVTEEIIEAAENMKVIGRAGIGLDNVDIEAATHRGIIVANAPQSNVVSAAEHTIALLLAQCRNIHQANQSLKAGRWERSKFQGVEVAGKTLGIFGLGRVGTVVASIAGGLGMKVIAHDPYLPAERFQTIGVERRESLEEVLKEADMITVHLPKTKETKGMFGPKEFNLMKDGVRLVNTARGGIFDEKALIDALKSGKVTSAGIDVFETEPCTSSPVFEFDQVIVTPHLGASTQEAQDRAGITIAEQVSGALKGEFVSNAVNIAAGEVADAIKPFLPLVEKLGKLFTHISEGKPASVVEIEYAGNIANSDTSMLTVAALKGIFAPIVFEPVTYVNAPVMAKERGFEIKEVKTAVSRDYVNMVVLRSRDTEEVAIGGTLVGPKNQERFISIFDFDVDMVPTKYMAFFQYADRPGMIGKVGTALGDHGINIANMEVGRRVIAGEALMGINVDSPIPETVMKEIIEQAGIAFGKFLEL